MERIINFRPLFFIFLAFALGIGFAYYIFSLDFLVITLTIIIFVTSLIFVIIRKLFKKFVLLLMAFIVGLSAFSLDTATYAKRDYGGETCAVIGRVTENVKEYNNFYQIKLDNVFINGTKEKNLLLSVWKMGGLSISHGYKISFTGDIYNHFLFENKKFNSYLYKNDVAYFAEVEFDRLTIEEGSLSLGESIRQYVKDVLYKFMPEKIAGLSFSVLFGDKSDLDSDIKKDFSTSGIAHLLAVSGLHIGFLVAILYWILKKLRCGSVPRLIVISIFLVCYCALCGFTASITRASIMAICILVLRLIGRQYDLLSSIGLAGIIVLIFNPLYVFDAGFLMSFLSVISIALLFKSFSKFFVKCKMPSRVADSLAIDLCTTIAILPIIANFFGQISAFSFLANLICIPIFALAYAFLFFITLIVCALNFLGFLLIIPSLLFKIIIWISGIIAGWEWAILKLYSFDLIIAFLFYLFIFFCSRFFMTKFFIKCTAISVAFILGLSTLLFVALPVKNTVNSVAIVNSYAEALLFRTSTDKVLVVGSKYLDKTTDFLRANNIKKVDILALTANKDEYYDEFVKTYKTTTTIGGLIDFSDEEFAIKYIVLEGRLKALMVSFAGQNILVALDKIGVNQALEIKNLLSENPPNILYQRSSVYNFLSVGEFDKIFSAKNLNIENNYSTLKRGNFTFDIKNGIMGEIRSEN